MGNQKYNLNKGEKVVYKQSCVRHGFWGAYTNILVITNQSIILEKYGLFSNFKGIERYNFPDIEQVIQGEAFNGEKQIEVYINNKVEDFALQSGDDDELKIIIQMINEQLDPTAEKHDYHYYQNIFDDLKDTKRLMELRKLNDDYDKKANSDLSLLGATAKNVIKSKNFTIDGISKGYRKAVRKQKQKKFFGEIFDNILEDSGIHDIQDDFTEIGNDFREGFGLKPKITNAERKELEKLEKKMRRREKERNIENTVNKQKKSLNEINKQLEALKKAKELYDSGILTKEEFEEKKKEILN